MFINAPTDSLTLTDPWPRVDRDLLDRFAIAPAANVGDVFDRMLVLDGGIRPFTSATRLDRHRPSDPDPRRGQPRHPPRPRRRPTRRHPGHQRAGRLQPGPHR